LDEIFIPSIELVGIKKSEKIEFKISKAEYIIGKKEQQFDFMKKDYQYDYGYSNFSKSRI